MMNLDALSLQELLEIKKHLPVLIARRQEEARKLVLQKAEDMAAKHGITLEELMGKGRRQLKPMYVNPRNSTEVWSGRGSRPKWVRDWLAEGRLLEDLKIKRED